MAVLKIARMGHPVLRHPAEPVPDPTAPSVHALVRDMVETLADAGGVGLAAPQVHVGLRVLLFAVPKERAGDPKAGEGTADGPVPLTVLINPVIEPVGDEMASDWEACLSVPGLTGFVPRHTRIRYSGVGLNGEQIKRAASGFHARVLQHEYDHLDGVLYPQRMTDLKMLGFLEETRRYPPVPRWAGSDDQQPKED
jgi:peptide deformylase